MALGGGGNKNTQPAAPQPVTQLSTPAPTGPINRTTNSGQVDRAGTNSSPQLLNGSNDDDLQRRQQAGILGGSTFGTA